MSSEIQRNGQDDHRKTAYTPDIGGGIRGDIQEKKERIRFKKTVLETVYFLAIVNRALMELATRLEQVATGADNFSFRYDFEKFKYIKQEALKTQCMNVYTALSDGF